MTPPVATLVAILQRHGLTVDALEDLVHFCEERRTGSVTFHIVEGTMQVLEAHGKRRLTDAQESCHLTKI